MAGPVRYATEGAAVRITLDRPEAKNAINLETIDALHAALDRAAREEGARVVVLAGAGGDFSAGGDIKDMLARRGRAVPTYDRLRRGLGALVETLTGHEKPIVAAIDGVCLGAGAGLALACDAALATRRSTLGFPFVKVGLVPDTATTWLLPHFVGLQNARRLLLTGDPVPADEAEALGLLTRVVEDAAALQAEVRAWVDRFAGLPPTAVRDAKRLVWGHVTLPLSTALVHEAMVQGLRFTTPEHAAAVDAFLAKRGSRR